MRVRFAEMARGVSRRGDGVFLVLQAYFDDAGTHAGSPVVCWGGFVGTLEQWDTLDTAWNAKLDRPVDLPTYAPQKPALPRFHLWDCEARLGLFSDYSRADSDALQRDFREIIYASGIVGVAYCIDLQAYDRVVADPAARASIGDAEQVCFAACWTGAMERARQYYPSETYIHLYFDYVMNTDRLVKLRAVADSISQEPGTRPVIQSASLAKTVGTTPLQAADIIATENFWDAKAYINDERRTSRPHLQDFLKNVRCDGYIMREPEIRATMWKAGFGAQSAARP